MPDGNRAIAASTHSMRSSRVIVGEDDIDLAVLAFEWFNRGRASRTVGEAGVRTVAHGFTRGKSRSGHVVSPPWRAKESFLSPAEAGSQIRGTTGPRLEAVGYGSYASFAG